MECKVEKGEIVLRISIDAIRNKMASKYFNNVTVVDDKFFEKLCERIVDDQDTGEDFYINDFLDDRIDSTIENYPEYVRLNDEGEEE